MYKEFFFNGFLINNYHNVFFFFLIKKCIIIINICNSNIIILTKRQILKMNTTIIYIIRNRPLNIKFNFITIIINLLTNNLINIITITLEKKLCSDNNIINNFIIYMWKKNTDKMWKKWMRNVCIISPFVKCPVHRTRSQKMSPTETNITNYFIYCLRLFNFLVTFRTSFIKTCMSKTTNILS